MNMNYKVVWNAASRCFVAVAEYAKSRGKSSEKVVSGAVNDAHINAPHLFILKALPSGMMSGVASLALLLSPNVSAAVGVNGGTGNGTAASQCMGISQANSGGNKENIAIGCEANTSNIGLKIADRGNPYYTKEPTLVDSSKQNIYTPRGHHGGAVAIGTGASTEKTFGVAIGDYAKTTEIAGVAIGIGTLSKGNTALAIGRQSVATADYAQAFGNVAAATEQGALAMGHSAAATGYRAIAIGATDIKSATPSYGQEGANYQAKGQTTASADDTIAFGSGAAASANAAMALGQASAATRAGAVALGSGATTATAANGVTSAVIEDRDFDNFAGSSNIDAGDQISVGAAGAERQIKNVAAGKVSAISTDAINGSQLFSVAKTLGQDITTNGANISNNTNNINNNTTKITTNSQNIKTNSDNINKGINFHVNGGERTYALGETIGVTTDSNIITTATDDGVNVALANALNIGANRPIAINGNDGTISGLTNTEFDSEITYSGGMAATQEQLQQLNSNINNNLNQGLNFIGDNTSIVINRKFDQTLSIKGGAKDLTDNNIGVVVDSDDNLNVKLSQDLGGLNSATFGDVIISQTGLSNGGNQITNMAAGVVSASSTDAVNGAQLHAQGQGIKAIIGGDTVYNSTDGSFSHSNIGGTGQSTIDEAIKAVQRSATAAKTTVTQGDNIVVTKSINADGLTNYQVATAKDLTLDSVTTGNSTLNNDGLALDDGAGNTTTITTAGTSVTDADGNLASYGADGISVSDSSGNTTLVNQGGISFTDSSGNTTGPSMSADGIDAGQRVITGVASGGNVATNAANIGDVQAAAAASKTEIAAGTNVSSVTKTTGEQDQDIYTINADGASVSAGSDAMTVTAGSKNANNVTDYAVDLSQAAKSSLANADSAMQTIVTQINGTDVKTINQTNNTANFVSGSNIVLSNDNGGIKVSTAQNLTANRVQTGNTTVSTDGVRVTGGPNNDVVLDNNGLDNGGNKITNVADGRIEAGSKDAINGGQLNDVIDSAISSEMIIMNDNVTEMGYRIDDIEDEANAGISAAMAMASLPQAFIPGKSMVGGGLASYNGESAVAVGVSKVSDNGRWVIKVNGTADTQGNAGGSVGAGFHF